jgi:hypothetical protein
MPNQPLVLAQPPYQSPMTDRNGMITDVWNKWLQQLYLRVGGAATAPIQNFNSIPLIQLISQPAPVSATTLYTSPIGQKTIINSLTITNNDFVARTVSVWFVPKGSFLSSTNIVVNNASIPPGTTQTFPTLQFQVLNGGDSIQAQGSVSSLLNIFANGRLSS